MIFQTYFLFKIIACVAFVLSTTRVLATGHSFEISTVSPRVDDYYPDISPTNSKVVFYSNRAGSYQIYTINLDGTDLEQLTFTNADNRTPVFSPDGNLIAYQSEQDGNREIYVMNADGTNPVNISNHTAEDSHPKWSGDGERIIFDSLRAHEKYTEIFIMDADGKNPKRLTSHNDDDSYASLSSDGSKILWRRILSNGGNHPTGKNSEIFIMNPDGSDIKNLTNHEGWDGYPDLSPDGNYVLFSSNRNRKGDFYWDVDIFMMRVDGSDVIQLTEAIPFVEQVRARWSKDGEIIIFNQDFTGERTDDTGTVIRIMKSPIYTASEHELK